MIQHTDLSHRQVLGFLSLRGPPGAFWFGDLLRIAGVPSCNKFLLLKTDILLDFPSGCHLTLKLVVGGRFETRDLPEAHSAAVRTAPPLRMVCPSIAGRQKGIYIDLHLLPATIRISRTGGLAARPGSCRIIACIAKTDGKGSHEMQQSCGRLPAARGRRTDGRTHGAT